MSKRIKWGGNVWRSIGILTEILVKKINEKLPKAQDNIG